MKENLKKYTLCLILMFIIAIIIGIFMILYPDISLATLGVITGIFMLVNGITLIVLDVKAWTYDIPFDGLLQGALRIILGILLFRNPETMSITIGIALGIWIIVSAVGGIKMALYLRKTDAPWVLMIILGVLNIFLGAAVLYLPAYYSMTMTLAVGIALVAHSILNIIYVFEIRKNIKEIEQIVKERAEQTEQTLKERVKQIKQSEENQVSAKEETQN